MLTCTYTRWEHMTRTHIHVKIVAKLWLERRPWTISSWLGFRCDQCWYRPIVEHVTWWHKPSHYDLDLNWRCQCRWIYLLKLAFYVQLKLCCQGLWGFSGPLVLNILGFLEQVGPWVRIGPLSWLIVPKKRPHKLLISGALCAPTLHNLLMARDQGESQLNWVSDSVSYF